VANPVLVYNVSVCKEHKAKETILAEHGLAHDIVRLAEMYLHLEPGESFVRRVFLRFITHIASITTATKLSSLSK
jgi:hypothetical protein